MYFEPFFDDAFGKSNFDARWRIAGIKRICAYRYQVLAYLSIARCSILDTSVSLVCDFQIPLCYEDNAMSEVCLIQEEPFREYSNPKRKGMNFGFNSSNPSVWVAVTLLCSDCQWISPYYIPFWSCKMKWLRWNCRYLGIGTVDHSLTWFDVLRLETISYVGRLIGYDTSSNLEPTSTWWMLLRGSWGHMGWLKCASSVGSSLTLVADGVVNADIISRKRILTIYIVRGSNLILWFGRVHLSILPNNITYFGTELDRHDYVCALADLLPQKIWVRD